LSATAERRALEGTGLLYGAAYYHEYQPYERLDRDVKLMAEAGLNVARVGESTWATWEPEDGRFELDWMRRIVDRLHGAGIKVILGTPTYAIPPWLHRKHPEIMARRAHGERVAYGGRQNVDVTHPAYRYHAERVIRTIVGAFAGHPAVIGYQLDNEAGLELLHNRGVFQAFVDHLRRAQGSVERLNELWGLTYWSHRLSSWADLWMPDGNTNPGYDLEWRRFQSGLVTEFLGWQAGLVREHKRPDQFVTHCLVGGHGRPAADRHAIDQVIDIPAENVYYQMQDALALPAAPGGPVAPAWLGQTGTWTLYLDADIARGGRESGFLVTETNALSIGEAHATAPAYDGQWRLAAYALIARGARGVSYWHWHTCHQGNETHWQGILNHDLEPGRCYREVSRIGAELAAFGDVLDGLEPDADVALLYSQDSKYALSFQPPLPKPGSGRPDRHSYQRIFDAFYRAFFDARAQLAVVHPPQRFERFPVLVVPALYIAEDALLERLVAYARAGGHLVVSFRSGYADEHARARWARAPGILREAVGASYQEYSSLGTSLGLTATDRLALPRMALATAWADGLEPEGATALATYDHPHFQRFAAVTTHRFGRGQVTYVGTLPSRELGRAVAELVLADAGVPTGRADLPRSVRVTTARARDGRRLWFVSNWSWDPVTVPTQVAGNALLSGRDLREGGAIELGAWGVDVLVEAQLGRE
jgi:beta-galactosidase